MLAILGFLLGIHLTMLLFAALYRLLDLNYDLRKHAIHIGARITLNLILIALVYYFSSGPFSIWFGYGQLFFTGFHVVMYWLGQGLAVAIYRRTINR